MNSLRRREFVALALSTAGSLRALEPHYRFPTEPRKRMAVSSYPFRRLIAGHAEKEEMSTTGMTLEQFAQTIGPKLDVPGIEPWSRHFKSTDESYVRGLRKSFDDAGIHVVNIPVDIPVHLCGSAEQRESGLVTYRKWIDTAVILGSPSIRVHLPRTPRSQPEAGENSCAVSALKELAEYGASKQIIVNIENDEPEAERPERIVRVLKTVNSAYLRALPDFCNSMLIHNDQAYNDEALGMLFPLAYNISHVKDMEVDRNKVYQVDVDRIFALAKKSGYKGYFSIEWEGKGDEYEETKKLIQASLKNLG